MTVEKPDERHYNIRPECLPYSPLKPIVNWGNPRTARRTLFVYWIKGGVGRWGGGGRRRICINDAAPCPMGVSSPRRLNRPSTKETISRPHATPRHGQIVVATNDTDRYRHTHTHIYRASLILCFAIHKALTANQRANRHRKKNSLSLSPRPKTLSNDNMAASLTFLLLSAAAALLATAAPPGSAYVLRSAAHAPAASCPSSRLDMGSSAWGDLLATGRFVPTRTSLIRHMERLGGQLLELKATLGHMRDRAGDTLFMDGLDVADMEHFGTAYPEIVPEDSSVGIDPDVAELQVRIRKATTPQLQLFV